MRYFKTKDSHMSVREINGVEFCTHITKDKVEWILFSLVNDKAVECTKNEVLDAWIKFSYNMTFNIIPNR